jgi:hypothetical protein
MRISWQLAIVRVIFTLLALLFAFPSHAEGEAVVKISDQDAMWDPFFVGHIDSWNVTIATYDRKVRPGKHISQDSDAIGAYFSKADFEKYTRESKDHALVKTLKKIETDDDKASLERLVQDSTEQKDTAFLTGDALGLFPALAKLTWPIQVLSVINGAMDQSGYVKNIKKTRTSIKDLVAKGGHIDTEERLYQSTEGDKPWMIYRCIVYRVTVGKELKSVPLFICTMHAFVK